MCYVVPTVYVMGGLFQVNPNFGGNSGWNFFEHGTTGLSVPLEVGWTPSFGPNNLLGHYKVGFNEDTSTYPDLFVSTNGLPIAVSGLPGQPHDGRRMYYAFADQMLVRTGKGDTDGLIAFGGFVHADARHLAVGEPGVRGPVLERKLHRSSAGLAGLRGELV